MDHILHRASLLLMSHNIEQRQACIHCCKSFHHFHKQEHIAQYTSFLCMDHILLCNPFVLSHLGIEQLRVCMNYCKSFHLIHRLVHKLQHMQSCCNQCMWTVGKRMMKHFPTS